MTRDQHLEAARWTGEWAVTHVNVNLSPGLAYERATTAAHHARAALQCDFCRGTGREPVGWIEHEDCGYCDGNGTVPPEWL